MRAFLRLKIMKLRSYTPSATQGALNVARAYGRATTAARRIAPMFSGKYDGAELRPFTVRPGALQALTLPSRMGNVRIFRDGRVAVIGGLI